MAGELEFPDLLDLESLSRPGAAAGTPLELDASIIRPSRWANRHESAFQGDEFAELKADILDAGGNVQPIMVRPLAQPVGDVRYEVVFGHRRHRACLELRLPVKAVVQDLDDQRLFSFMERENRSRQNLSAYEQGTMYCRALNEGLFTSLRQLAASIGRSQGDVSNAMAIAQLPQPVLQAFRTPGEIQFRFAKDLKDAVARDEAAVVEVARSLVGQDRPAAEVFQTLATIGKPAPEPQPSPESSSAVVSHTAAPGDARAAQPEVACERELVLEAEHKGKLVEIQLDRRPQTAGTVYVRKPGSPRRLVVPAVELRLKGWSE